MPHQEKSSIHISKKQLFIVIMVLSSLIPALFLLNSTLLSGDEVLYTGSLHRITEHSSLWTQSNFGMSVGTRMWLLMPLGAFYVLLNSLVGLSIHYVQFLYVFVSFMFGLGGFAYLLRSLKKDPYSFAGYLASIFYMYNIYNVRLLGGPFQFLLPYALTPLFLGLFIRGIEYKSYKHFALCSIVLASIFGPNLTLGVIAVFIAAVYILADLISSNNIRKFLRHVLSLVMVSTVTFFLIAWWFLPNIIITKSSSAEVASVLTSESFYNLDTGVSNVLRNLGDWSFFSAHKGTPYVPYAGSYAKNPIVILCGFLPLLAMLFCLAYLKKGSKKTISIFATLSVLISIFIIGGTNQQWISSPFFRYLFENFSVLQIFRNTFKFTVLITLAFSIFIYLFANTVVGWLPSKKFKILLVIVFILPAYPLVFSKAVNPTTLVDKFPNYWQSMSECINKDKSNTRTLLLPDQYFSVYKWDNENKNLGGGFEEAIINAPLVHDTCKGCANVESTELIKTLTTSFSNANYTKLLNIAGVGAILQRNDIDYTFYGTSAPDEINSTLRVSENISLDKEIGSLSYYKVDESYPSIYAPQQFVASPDKDIFGLLGRFNVNDRLAIVNPNNDKDILSQLNAVNYQSAFYRNEDVGIVKNIASSKLDGDLGKNALDLTLDNPTLLLNTAKDLVIYSGKNTQDPIIFKKPDIIMKGERIDNDMPSYVLGEPVSDVNYTLQPDTGSCRSITDTPSHTTIITLDDTLKKPALELNANGSLGCTTSKLFKLNKNKNYLLWFDYKVVKGDYFGYCVSYNGDACVKADILKSNDNEWHRYYAEFNSNRVEDFSKSKLFFYAPALNAGKESTVRYSNINAFEINSRPLITRLTDAITGENNTLNYAVEKSGGDLIPDPYFNQDGWLTENKSCALVLESSRFSTKLFTDATNYTGIELSSSDTTACTQSKNFNVENNSKFLLEIDYKVIEGKSFGFCVYGGNGCLANEYVEVDPSDEWKTYSKVVQLTNPSRQSLSMYLYSSNENESSRVQFKSVSLHQIDGYELPQLSITTNMTKLKNIATIKSVTKKSPTNYELEVSTEIDGMASIAFLESFTPAWKMKVGTKLLDSKSHYKINTFANGWSFDVNNLCKNIKCDVGSDGKYSLHISIFYEPQKIVKPSVLLSALSYVIIIGVLTITLIKEERHKR